MVQCAGKYGENNGELDNPINSFKVKFIGK
ncbi:Uncharacterised protein [Avibacterium paragallinarum]|uniref:Uncharacterized protein n=1 Tax=Avibacterium paragallinarum TaxID=728 RepID=A0A380Z1W5_AVIPA|nr:Uncharacterised protein [Avibacterium paragallinarum]SUV40977.1 Uncharacterised protein [Avibacterium paragallinarum]